MKKRYEDFLTGSLRFDVEVKRNWHHRKFKGRKRHDRRKYWLANFGHEWKIFLKKKGNKVIRHSHNIPNGGAYRKVFALNWLWY